MFDLLYVQGCWSVNLEFDTLLYHIKTLDIGLIKDEANVVAHAEGLESRFLLWETILKTWWS